jgi:Flp pilus assembly protein TadG
MSIASASRRRPALRRASAGQSLVEFAVIVPVMLLILLGIADFGRLFTSAIAVEAAGREAADYGAFDASYWTAANLSTTVGEMQRRACTAAAGSHLEGYATTDPSNASCTNPTFACFLERNGASTDCLGSSGMTDSVDCSNPATEPPCTVHVRMTYEFDTLLPVGPMAGRIELVRDSRFRISNLQPAP